MRDLVDVHYPQADLVRVVMDNLSTHTAGALYETFPAPEAHRILRRLEFHYTPKYASWLNMVEIEIGVLRGQARARIKWMFTVERARMARGHRTNALSRHLCLVDSRPSRT
jgi:DDE superfamily endonuclease